MREDHVLDTELPRDAALPFGRAAWEKGPMVMKAATLRVIKA
jgi:hypothetical protein